MTPDDSQWLTIETPDGPFVWHLGEPSVDELPELVNRARVAAGVPSSASGMPDDGYAVMHYRGRPHRSLLERAALGDRATLAGVAIGTVTAYTEERNRLARAAHVEAARTALGKLTPEERAAVVAELRGGR